MSKECRTPAPDTSPEHTLFPTWIRYEREEYARPNIVEALDTAMQAVVMTYELAEDLAEDLAEAPALQRFVAMRQAVLDRAVAEGAAGRVAADLKMAEKVLANIRRGLPID